MQQTYSAMLHFLDQSLEGLTVHGLASEQEARDEVLRRSGYVEGLPSDARIVVWRRPAQAVGTYERLYQSLDFLVEEQGPRFRRSDARRRLPPTGSLARRVADIVSRYLADGEWRTFEDILRFVGSKIRPAPSASTLRVAGKALGVLQRLVPHRVRGTCAEWKLTPQRVSATGKASPEGVGTEG